MVRPPAVAGRFYPSQPQELLAQVEKFLSAEPPAARVRARGCVVPHAGYMYSGHVAGAVYARLELPRRFILLCPRHFPEGEPVAIVSSGAWRTPLGDAEIDSALAVALKQATPLLREDAVAHRIEHSLEVQLPFLQKLAGAFRFVPVAIHKDHFGSLEEIGQAVAEVVAAQTEPVMVVASSDMNHYESDEVTRKKDRRAIAPILALDARGLFDVVRREGITMCGYAPTVALLVAAKQLGATRAELVRYATSGDINGDLAEVVGYAGIVIP